MSYRYFITAKYMMSTDNFNRQFQIKSGLSDKSINKKVEHKLEEEKDST